MDEVQSDIEKGVQELEVKKNCARSGVIFGKRLRITMASNAGLSSAMYSSGAKLIGAAKDRVKAASANMGKAGKDAVNNLIGGISGLFGRKEDL